MSTKTITYALILSILTNIVAALALYDFHNVIISQEASLKEAASALAEVEYVFSLCKFLLKGGS